MVPQQIEHAPEQMGQGGEQMPEAQSIKQRLAKSEIRRVLAVRASRLGDLLMTTPTIHAFRQRWPEIKLDLLTNPYCRELVSSNPDIDQILSFEGKERALAGKAGRDLAARIHGHYDLLLALRPRPELARFAQAAGIPHLFPQGEQSTNRQQHVVQQCFDRMRPLGLAQQAGPLRLPLRPEELDAARRDFGIERPFVLLHPGCDESMRFKLRRGVRRRIWPNTHWTQLVAGIVTQLEHDVVLSSGSEIEGRWTQRIQNSAGWPCKRVHRTSLRRLAALSALAAACVTVDTGPLHLACAVGTPLIGLYGPSPVEFTGPWAPPGQAHVLRADLPCMPCQGQDVQCPRNVCMEEIRVAQVLETLASALGA